MIKNKFQEFKDSNIIYNIIYYGNTGRSNVYTAEISESNCDTSTCYWYLSEEYLGKYISVNPCIDKKTNYVD